MTTQRNVFLIGFSGSGKSTVGRILAANMKYGFVDLDVTVEKHSRQPIEEIFANEGEQSFRRMEVSQLYRVLKSTTPMVIALGGGAFETAVIRQMARRHGVTAFLSCSQRELYRRLQRVKNRPLLETKPRRGETSEQARKRHIRDLLKKRLANYRTADLILSTTDRTAAQAARRLAQFLKMMR
jgi:shikimate kinase